MKLGINLSTIYTAIDFHNKNCTITWAVTKWLCFFRSLYYKNSTIRPNGLMGAHVKTNATACKCWMKKSYQLYRKKRNYHKKNIAEIKIKVNHWFYLFMISDFPVFAIENIKLNFNSPTAVTLTLTFFPVPTLLKGTQVYTPSDITVTLKIPELLVLLSLPLKYKWNLASGLASARHVKLRGLLRSTVVLLGTEMSFAPAGASKKKKESNHENDKGYRQLLLSVSALGVLYFTCANERVAISFIVFVNTQHEKTLMER